MLDLVAARETLGFRIALFSIGIGIILAATKLLVGTLAGSTAVVADGVESVADVFASSILLFGLWVAARPADANHPYGHGRFETLTGLGIGLGLAITGIGIASSALNRIGETHPPPESFAVWPLMASILAKTGMSVAKFRTGRKIGSSALQADAWNDTVDILSGLVALAAVALTLINPARWLAADHIGGFLVGLIVVFLGLRVVRETIYQLMDTMPDDQTMAQIRAVATSVPGALGVEKCFARKTGLRYHVDLHLEVDPDMSVRHSHEIASQVRDRVKERLDWVADVLVHVEPYGLE